MSDHKIMDNEFSLKNPILNGRPLSLYNMKSVQENTNEKLLVEDLPQVENECFDIKTRKNIEATFFGQDWVPNLFFYSVKPT